MCSLELPCAPPTPWGPGAPPPPPPPPPRGGATAPLPAPLHLLLPLLASLLEGRSVCSPEVASAPPTPWGPGAPPPHPPSGATVPRAVQVSPAKKNILNFLFFMPLNTKKASGLSGL